ncbi:hypothetical protein DY000_02064404 [Brassica cretica]|uniref:Uncharacterized protein n=1 Tax=Brassica cretica TaxID=69181 RepID=A0ABQ7E1D4_BRACR|nr:hypothetical protein DY000_02064404 [Brassica cretica]
MREAEYAGLDKVLSKPGPVIRWALEKGVIHLLQWWWLRCNGRILWVERVRQHQLTLPPVENERETWSHLVSRRGGRKRDEKRWHLKSENSTLAERTLERSFDQMESVSTMPELRWDKLIVGVAAPRVS